MSASRQSKAAIVNALENSVVALMKEMPFDSFSVKDLCERAGVGRSSFYRYYSSKEDVVCSMLLHLWQAWCKSENMKDQSVISPVSARSFLRHCYENKEIFDLIYRNKLNSLFPIIIEKNHEGGLHDYRVLFFCYGVFGIIREWWMRGCIDPLDELMHVLDSLSILDDRFMEAKKAD